MSRDVYISLSGASAAWTQLEVVSNNLANASTTGFKQDRVPFKLEGPKAGPLGQVYTNTDQIVADFSDGAVRDDGDPYHFALQGDGFLAVQTGDRVGLTRDGRFHVDRLGRVVNNSGFALLGESGPITVPPGETLRVGEDGRVYGDESGEIDRLRIVSTTSARRLGDNLWEPTGGLAPSTATVVQGALENSNVSPMHSMLELIEVGRYFEAYQKAMQTSDELDGRMNRLGGKG